VDTITNVNQARLQKNGVADVTNYDVSVKWSDTGGGCSMRHCRSVDVRTQSQSPVPERGHAPRLEEEMNGFVVPQMPRQARRPELHTVSRFLVVLICCGLAAPAQQMTQRGNTSASFSTRATHLLGFANARNNSTGTLSVQDDSLQFQQNGKPGAKVKIALVRGVFLGAESKQVGGLPMTLGKTAAPFGSGRVVSLFAHKKYDTLSLEYVDADGGIHGAIFQLTKGQGELVRNELIARGVATSSRQDQSTKQSAAEAKHEN
jgi:hypothetical protein